MYQFLSEISSWLSGPFAHAAQSSNVALLAALFFGFTGSVAPCQLTANLGSITYFGHKYMSQRLSGVEFLLYLMGKMLVYSLFGVLFWIFGQSVSTDSIPVFVYARKIVGPLLIFIGLYFLGVIKLRGTFGFRISAALKHAADRTGGKKGAFLLGAAFSLGFCPTMVLLFFGLVMPLALQSAYGFILPSVFAVGTAFPLLIFFAVMIGFGLDRAAMKKIKVWGRTVHKLSGLFLIVLGISDTVTYWGL